MENQLLNLSMTFSGNFGNVQLSKNKIKRNFQFFESKLCIQKNRDNHRSYYRDNIQKKVEKFLYFRLRYLESSKKKTKKEI